MIYLQNGKIAKKFNSQVEAYLTLQAQIDSLKAEQTAIKTYIFDEVKKQDNVKSVKADNFSIVYKNASTKISLDTKKFKDEQKKLFEQYSKKTPVADSIAIKRI